MNRSATAFLTSITFICIATLSGCPAENKAPTVEPAPASAKSPAEQAQEKFQTLCAACHGETGKGDTPAAANLDPKPRDYTDAAWQDSVDDAYLSKVIVEGGAAAGKSALMPGSPDLKDKPEVVAELVKMIRSFKK